MYLRTAKRKNTDGSVAEYYQLAHNVLHARTGSPVAGIIHNFGGADEINRGELVRLSVDEKTVQDYGEDGI